MNEISQKIKGKAVMQEFSSIKELLDADKINPMSWQELDDELWIFLSNRISDASELNKYPDEIKIYLATRLLEWQVGNGGFAQAAYNSPDWFQPAMEGYRYFEKENAALLIGEAISILESEQSEIESKGLREGVPIGEVCNHFKESEMSKLDEKIPQDEWWSDEYRITFVRSHRELFSSVK